MKHAVGGLAALAVGLIAASVFVRRRRRRRWHARGDADSLSAFTVTVSRGAPSKATVSVVGASERAWSFGIGWVQGMYYPPFVDEARLAWLQRAVRLRPDDVVIVTYAKCGTTWAEQVVLLLLARGDLGRLDPLHKNAYSAARGAGKVWCEAALVDDEARSGAAAAAPFDDGAGGEGTPVGIAHFRDAMPSPRVIKTHARARLLLGRGGGERDAPQPPARARLIYVTRNPKDACVSGFYHAFNPHKQGWPFGAWAAAWSAGHVPSGAWFDHVREWREEFSAAERAGEPRLWLHYEAMLADPERAVARVADFLWPAGRPAWCDAAAIARVARACGFDAMRAASAAAADARASRGLKVWAPGRTHLRKGVAGDWREHFSPVLSAEFDRLFEERMAGTGLVYDMGDGERLVAPARTRG